MRITARRVSKTTPATMPPAIGPTGTCDSPLIAPIATAVSDEEGTTAQWVAFAPDALGIMEGWRVGDGAGENGVPEAESEAREVEDALVEELWDVWELCELCELWEGWEVCVGILVTGWVGTAESFDGVYTR